MTLIKQLNHIPEKQVDAVVPSHPQFKIYPGFFQAIVQKYKSLFNGSSSNDTNSPIESPKKVYKSLSKLTDDLSAVIRSWVDQNCLITLGDIEYRLLSDYGMAVSKDKLAGCLSAFHFSINRTPDVGKYPVEERCLPLLRKVFADDYKAFIRRPNVFCVGATKVHVSTRVYQGKKASPRWSIKTKTFTICVALRKDKLYMYQALEDVTPAEPSPSSRNVGSQDCSHDSMVDSYKFMAFYKQFVERLGQENIKRSHVIMDGPRFHNIFDEDMNFLNSVKQHKIQILPDQSTFFNATEYLFDQLRSYVNKFEPNEPEKVFASIKNIPSVIDAVECSRYFGDVMDHIKVWSNIHWIY